MNPPTSEPELRIDPVMMRTFSTELLVRVGLPFRGAALTADALVSADLRGISYHGVNRLAHYVERIRNRTIKAAPQITVEDLSPATARVDGDCGMGQVGLSVATDEAIRRSRQVGASWVAVKNTNHCGALPYYALRISKAGLIGIVMTHTEAVVAPFGATERFLGTNPLCITFPGRADHSICLDFATSVVAWNKIVDARDEKKSVPVGWGVDALGQDTTDPDAIVAIHLFGGHKGSGLAMVIDLFSFLLSGAPFGADLPAMYAIKQTRRLGALVGAIDVNSFGAVDDVKRRIYAYVQRLHALKSKNQGKGVYFRGELELIAVRRNNKFGIRISSDLVRQLQGLARRYYITSVIKPKVVPKRKFQRVGLVNGSDLQTVPIIVAH